MRVEFQNLSKQYEPGQVILNPMDFADDVHTLAIIGPSGGGKSTLLRIIGGLIAPTTGKLWVDSQEIKQNESALQQYRKKIGFVFQQGGLFRHMTALDNIAIPLEQVHGYDHSRAYSRAMELLERFGLKDDGKKKPASALDPEYTTEVLGVIRELKEDGMNFIIVTHEMGFARHACDKVAFLCEGTLMEYGESAQLFGHPGTEQLHRFLGKLLEWNI